MKAKFLIIIFTYLIGINFSFAENNDQEIYSDGCNTSSTSGSCVGMSMQLENTPIGDFDSPPERLKFRRKKLEQKNKKFIDKKIEDIRVKQEIALTNKLQNDLIDKNKKSTLISDTKKQESLNEIVKEFLANPKTLQSNVNNEERLDSIKTNAKGVIYNITLLKILTNDSKIESSKINSSTTSLKDEYCHSLLVKRLRVAGFNITNSYKAINGDLLYEVTTTPSDCL